MQKKILTAAIGAALAGPAFVAQADVTVYGAAQVEWAQVDNGSNYVYGNPGAGIGNWNNSNTIPANTTRSGLLDNKRGRFGIKASEDLGSGWTGLAQFEWQVDTADAYDGGAKTSPISDRVSTVGIANKAIGTLRFGQDGNPYKMSGVVLDPFVATTLEARNNYGMSGNRDGWGVANAHGSFWQDSLFFNSASFGGAYVNLAIGLDRTGANGTCATGVGGAAVTSNCDAAGTNGSNGKNNGDLDVAVGWKGNVGVGLHVFGAYTKLANTTSPDEPTAMKIGGQVTVAKAHTISLQYEMTDRGDYAGATGDGFDEGKYLFLGYQGKFGPMTAVVQVGQFENSAPATYYSYEGKYAALGLIYNMSKTFRVFGGLRKTELEATGVFSYTARDEQVLSVGMRKDF